jgi:hypothetical protein
MAVESLVNLAATVEAELDRLRSARPGLALRIARAEHMLATHLSCRQAQLIRIRCRGASFRFLVSGSAGAVYVVDPTSWLCSCPDHHRRDAACKHSIACWVLSKVTRATTRAKTPQCDGCHASFSVRDLFDVGEGNMTFYEGERVCRECARAHGVL